MKLFQEGWTKVREKTKKQEAIGSGPGGRQREFPGRWERDF